MAEWWNGPYLRGRMQNHAFIEQWNAVTDYPSGGGIWNSTIAEFGLKLYLRAEFGVKDYTRKRNERIIGGGKRNECKIFLAAREVREELTRIDSYTDSNTLHHCAVV